MDPIELVAKVTALEKELQKLKEEIAEWITERKTKERVIPDIVIEESTELKRARTLLAKLLALKVDVPSLVVKTQAEQTIQSAIEIGREFVERYEKGIRNCPHAIKFQGEQFAQRWFVNAVVLTEPSFRDTHTEWTTEGEKVVGLSVSLHGLY
jgi:hypothetical protein